MSGLRLMVMGVNENRVLCELQANRQTNCNEMETVRRGLKDMYALQDYVDAQAGGPGKGFFQIVKSPYDARRVINQGRMAVVLARDHADAGGKRPDDLAELPIDARHRVKHERSRTRAERTVYGPSSG